MHKDKQPRSGNQGKVFWAQAQKIDRKDKKKRRRMVVMKDNGEHVQVSQLKSVKEDTRPGKLAKIKPTYPGLTEDTGVAERMYNKRADTHEKLKLSDREVFDSEPVFELDDEDYHRVKSHVKRRGNKKESPGKKPRT